MTADPKTSTNMADNTAANLTLHHISNYFVTWMATIPMVTVSLVTLLANGTVLTMFAIRPSLRRAKNAYLASLALADFLIGCYMPVLVLEEVGLISVEGSAACRTYLTVRYSLLYVSLLSVLLITLDRWWSVRWPFSYRTRHTRRLAGYLIAGLWTLSTTIYALPIFLWDASSPNYDMFPLPAENYHYHHLLHPPPPPSSDVRNAGAISSAALRLPATGAATAAAAENLQHHHHPVDHLAYAHPRECEVPYAQSFAWSALTCFAMYLVPLGAMWILNCSLYQKIRLRRSVEIRRSTSVTDMFYVTMKNSKPTIHITEAPSIVGPSCNDLPTSSSPLLPLRPSSPGPAIATPITTPVHHHSYHHCSSTPQLNSLHPDHAGGSSSSIATGRRHSSALVSLSPSQALQQQQQQQQQSEFESDERMRRQLSQRRISLPDWAMRGDWAPSSASNTTSRCRYVGRKWSGCGGGSTNHLGLAGSSTVLMGLSQDPLCGHGEGNGAGDHHRRHSNSGNGDTVHELLVKQDQKVACCLALLLAACTVCCLPFACLTLLRAHCPSCVTRAAIVLCRWLLLSNSAINPFLYGLLNAQFRNILRQWFYLDTSQRYRPARGDTYVYMGVSRHDAFSMRGGAGDFGESAARDTSHVALSVMAPSSCR